MNKTVVYTAIYGGKDNIKERQFMMPSTDYILFTDNKQIKSKTWNVIYVPAELNCPVRNARKLKILPHKWVQQYERSVWIDGSMQLLKDFTPLLDSGTKWMVFGHGRYCVYEEAIACIKLKKDNPTVIQDHVEKYRKIGYPKNNGLWCNGVLIRKHNDPDIIRMNEMWWEEIQNGSGRDQLSAPYVAWKCGLTPDYIDGITGDIIGKNDWIRLYGHVK